MHQVQAQAKQYQQFQQAQAQANQFQQAKQFQQAEQYQQAQTQAQERLDLIITHIYSEFNENQWNCSKGNNIVIFANKLAPLDEFYVETSESSLYEIKVSIPVNEVNYIKTFMNINEAIAYIKMHVALYDTLYRR